MMWRAWSLARVLLTLSAALVVIGCTEHQVHVTGASGPIAWQVTDFRIVARSVQGTPRRSVHVYVGAPRNPRDGPDVSAGGLQAHAPIYPNVASAVSRSLAASPAWRTAPALFLPLMYHRRL